MGGSMGVPLWSWMVKKVDHSIKMNKMDDLGVTPILAKIEEIQ
jgi:hypothetical protein